MGSKRLPGKVLKIIKNHPMLFYLLKRINFSNIKNIHIATSTNSENDKIIEYIENNFKEIKLFRGDENDVFSRFHQIANEFNYSKIIRITADCPLIDFRIIDYMNNIFENEKKLDYLANTVPYHTSTYPDGMDVEIFSLNAINKANELNLNQNEKENVTHCFIKKDFNFYFKQIEYKSNLNKYKLSVDSQTDFNLISRIITNFVHDKIEASMEEIIEYMNKKIIS